MELCSENMDLGHNPQSKVTRRLPNFHASTALTPRTGDRCNRLYCSLSNVRLVGPKGPRLRGLRQQKGVTQADVERRPGSRALSGHHGNEPVLVRQKREKYNENRFHIYGAAADA